MSKGSTKKTFQNRAAWVDGCGSTFSVFMKIEQQLFAPDLQRTHRVGDLAGLRPQFALAFGGRHLLERPNTLSLLRQHYAGARLVLASTSGEITGTRITDDHLSVTAVALEKTRVTCSAISVANQFESRAAGRELATRLCRPGLVHVFIVSDGQRVNGTELARGFNDVLPPGITLTGGLAGDGERFEKTLVGLDEPPVFGRIVALGFYGQHLTVGFGTSGGWTPFGQERTVTSADGNILFQLDREPALDLYRAQLGSEADALPASALRFPLSVTAPQTTAPVVRAVLGVDPSSSSLVFAGDVPTGSQVRFMQASHEDLISGAARAAEQAQLPPGAELAICVSCVARRVVLGSRTEGETAAVHEILGAATALAGFYSYGELAPTDALTGCQLHNQTMTITTLRET